MNVELFILIDLVLETTFLRQYPIGECCECGDNCDPRFQVCGACNEANHKITEIAFLEDIFKIDEIVLP